VYGRFDGTVGVGPEERRPEGAHSDVQRGRLLPLIHTSGEAEH
jgi:hypothetical protein